MDKLYKTLFLKAVKSQMAQRLPEFELVKPAANAQGYDVFVGSMLYRQRGAADRCAWLKWSPGPGMERYFHVSLGWSSGTASLPYNPVRDERTYSARGPILDLPGGCIDLEQIEGRSGVGGITIPTPWDQLLLVKAAAPRAVQQAAQMKAFAEAQALSEADRALAVDVTLNDVFNRIQAKLPDFVAALKS
ncbi:MAG: hypothetical protein Tsb007_30990 [Rhizobacter sp.]